MNTFGRIFRLTDFGETHGPCMGGVIDGCPSGLRIDTGFVQQELDRRALKGYGRCESDKVRFVSGIYDGCTVAVVKDTVQERMQEVYNNGDRGAMIIVQKQSGANSVQISKKVMDVLPDIQKTLPPDVEIGIIANTSDSITNTVESLEETILIILALVVLVVLFFLGTRRCIPHRLHPTSGWPGLFQR